MLEFVRRTSTKLVKPDLLGLPARTGTSYRVLSDSAGEFAGLLLAGDEESARQLVIELYLQGAHMARIADLVIAPAMHKVGEAWECGDAEIYQERVAVNICQRLVTELSSFLPRKTEGPIAIGATPAFDQYSIATMLAELALRQDGWRAHSLGSNLPFDTIRAAVADLSPAVVWLSVSYLQDRQEFIRQYKAFVEQIAPVPVVIGGRALDHGLVAELPNRGFCATFQQLQESCRAIIDQRA